MPSAPSSAFGVGIHAYREAARKVVSFLIGVELEGFDAFRPAHIELATQLAAPSPGVAAERRRKAEQAAEEESTPVRRKTEGADTDPAQDGLSGSPQGEEEGPNVPSALIESYEELLKYYQRLELNVESGTFVKFSPEMPRGVQMLSPDELENLADDSELARQKHVVGCRYRSFMMNSFR